ncbi:MAG: hypothetical protein FMNOHCHN_01789 [Ignavibacteriaceae bacterium]|nr:hypothetical protein [Ignavibacteriaceae bacterium]
MSSKDLHSEPFDSGTIAKLEIFENYAEAWIPTFVMQDHVKEIHIFDFFAGPGYDLENVPGSPIRILQCISRHLGIILSQKTKVILHFNEYEPEKKKQHKFDALRNNCNEFVTQIDKFKYFLKINYYNEAFESLFFKLLPIINKYPALLYLDQYGVKFIAQDYLLELEQLRTTDFLYFVSSSSFVRYGSTPEFMKVLLINPQELEQENYKNIHRLIINKLRSTLPINSELKLFPFTIKKNSNIYGIIFGSKNYAAVDKFLRIAWSMNSINGEADFDIDDDKSKFQLDIFEGKKKTKIERFQEDFESLILNKVITNNKDALLYTYSCGHIHSHADQVVRKLKRESKIDYIGRTPGINYVNVFRYHINIAFKIKE